MAASPISVAIEMEESHVVRFHGDLGDAKLENEEVDAQQVDAQLESKQDAEIVPQKEHLYVQYFRKLKAKQDLPDLAITFEDMHRKIPVPDTSASDIPNIIKSTTGMFSKKKTKDFYALQNSTSSILPGRMTLILAPPGHGKSCLLKTLAGLYSEEDGVGGKLLYNGKTFAENLQNGTHVQRMISYVDQIENHISLLTVRETFEFALQNCCVDPSFLNDPELNELHKKKVDLMLSFLGLEECESTIVGNEVLRGVSGGQKRRVTVGEMLLSDARAFFLDEISNGLDALRTYQIFDLLKSWCRATNISVTASLLQPAPDLFNLFDDVILLKDGAIVYHGPTSSVQKYFEELGIICPVGQDFGDFIVEFLNDPPLVWENFKKRKAKELASKSSSQLVNNNINVKRPPLSTAQLVEAWKKHPLFATQLTQIEFAKQNYPPIDLSKSSEFARISYGHSYPHSYVHHFNENLVRQTRFFFRNTKFLIPRVFKYIIFGLIVGSLFWDLNLTNYPNRIGVIFVSFVISAFVNMSEIPLACEARNICVKQVNAAFYPASAYILATLVVHLFWAAIEAILFCVVLYYMTNLVNDSNCFGMFFFVNYLLSLATSTLFRAIAFSLKSKDVAQMIAAPVGIILSLFGGFLVTYRKIPNFMWEFFWFSPFSWAVRLVAQNQYAHSSFDFPITSDGVTYRFGDYVLEQYQISADKTLGYCGILYLFGFYLFFAAISSLALSYSKLELSRGTRRIDTEDEDEILLEPEPESILPARLSTLSSMNVFGNDNGLPFQPVAMTFEHVIYTVKVPNKEGSGTVDRILLNDVTGFARPYQMTALMGSSGAGKTTLLDVLAQKKTEGTIKGKILLNGLEPTPTVMSQLCGYCEQIDMHDGMQTVREALMFSAALRLPASVTAEQRMRFVDETLKMLELDQIADRLVGDEHLLSLSPGQLKRLTIGVELVANPSVLFLDEPTSGLDSRSALIVMRTIKKIAACGRSVIVTIHQPSSNLFFLFDRLLLLKSGGLMVYFGDVGPSGSTIVNYFQNSCPEADKMPENTNPATWMLERLNDADVDFPSYYRQNKLSLENNQVLTEIFEDLKIVPATKIRDSLYAAPLAKQFVTLYTRFNLDYFRDSEFNAARWGKLLVVGIFCGLLWLQITANDFAGAISKISVFLITVTNTGAVQSSSLLPVLMRGRAVFYREKLSRYYNPIIYALCLFLTEIPYIFVAVAINTIPVYFMVGLKNSFVRFVQFFFAVFMYSLCISCNGLMLVAASPNLMAANVIQSTFLSFFNLFAGVYIQASAIPRGWKWLYYMLPSYKGVIAAGIPQFLDASDQETLIEVQGNKVSLQQFVFDFFETGAHAFGPNIGWLFLTLFVYLFLIGFAFAKISHIKR